MGDLEIPVMESNIAALCHYQIAVHLAKTVSGESTVIYYQIFGSTVSDY